MEVKQDTVWKEDIPGSGKVTIRISENKQYWWAGDGWDWTDVQHRTLQPISEENTVSRWEIVRQYVINEMLPKMNQPEDPPEAPQKFYRFKHLELD